MPTGCRLSRRLRRPSARPGTARITSSGTSAAPRSAASIARRRSTVSSSVTRGLRYASITASYAAASSSTSASVCPARCSTASSAPSRVARSASEPFLVRDIDATIASSDSPTDAVSAAADPPPGVGAALANAASSSRTGRSVSRDIRAVECSASPDGRHQATWRPFLMTARIGDAPGSQHLDRRPIHDDDVAALADFQAADVLGTVEREGGVERRADQRLFERQTHARNRRGSSRTAVMARSRRRGSRPSRARRARRDRSGAARARSGRA